MTTNKLYCFLLLGCLALGITSCNKDDFETDFDLARQFTPTDVTILVQETQVQLKWSPSLFTTPGEVSYSVMLSTDSLFQSPGIITKETDTAGITFDENEIVAKQRYFAMIKANGADGTADSKWGRTPAFTMPGPQIFLAVATADLTPNSVTLRWRLPNPVTHIMLGTRRLDISTDEQVAGAKTIAGLTPSTSYTAEIFNSASSRGTVIFQTLSDLPFGPNVVYVTATDDLAAKIQAAVSGNIFVLLQGTKYDSGTSITFPAGISFTVWGQPGVNLPIVSFNGITLPATAGTIRFENIDFTGYPNNDPTQTKRGYIFNQGTITTTSEIIFENCTIRNFANSPMRIQGSSPITIDKFNVNNCIVYDIGNNGPTGSYAFIHSSVSTGKINNITISNSTFRTIAYSLILHNSASSASVVIENNTLNNVVGDNRYLIDYNAQLVPQFTFRNNIIGKTFSPANTANGIRYNGANLIVDNSYKTSESVMVTRPIPGIGAYSKPYTDLFTDPDNGNFRIKDATFSGVSTAGDPRWRP